MSCFKAIGISTLLSLLLLSACDSSDDASTVDTDGDSDGPEAEQMDGDTVESDVNDTDITDGDPDPVDGDLVDADTAATDGDETVDGDATDGDLADGDAGEADSADGEVNACTDAIALTCGDLYNGDTSASIHDLWYGYSCTAKMESGNEAIFSFQLPQACDVDLRLTDLGVDLDLMVLSDCEPFSCLAVDSSPLDIQDGESVSFSAEADTRYYIVVDGYNEAVGTFTLAVDCDCGDADGDAESE